MSEQSRHCYPGTEVLVNLAGLREQRQLDAFERTVAGERIAELQVRSLSGRFDLHHWQEIHRHIFRDIYPFSGKLRDEVITKGDLRYAQPEYIAGAAGDVFRQLKAEGHLVGLDRPAFIDRLSHYMTELYGIHPFREGNSRSLREFTRTLGLQAGYELQWPHLPRVNWFETMRAAFYGRYDNLRNLLDRAVLNREPSRELMTWFRSLDHGRSR